MLLKFQDIPLQSKVLISWLAIINFKSRELHGFSVSPLGVAHTERQDKTSEKRHDTIETENFYGIALT